ncbi:hypothetical protein BGW39_001032 [Mortierella sp. 14UC]|nr:hypothetical protein BGW39_001032 [Mortierella sp. 14UC]
MEAAETLHEDLANTVAVRAIGNGTGDRHFLLLSAYLDPVAYSLDGTARDSYSLGRIIVSETSGNMTYDDTYAKNPLGSIAGAICGVVILGVLAVFLYKRRRNKAKAAQDIAQVEAGPDTQVDVDSKPMAVAGPSDSQATAAQSAATQPPSTTILPMAPITSPLQQQHNVQNQMQELGFSSHPRPTVASVATGEPWQPTPFVPPTSSRCLATTPDASTFYGFDYTPSTDDTLSEYKEANSFVIIKSNANPTSPTNLSWTVWSRVYLDDLPPMSLSGGTSCAVSNEGVFTIFFRQSSSSYNLSKPYGFRYDPNGKPGSGSVAGNNGRGAWIPVKFRSYDWSVFYDIQLLEYVNGPTGLQLVHCHKDSYTVHCAIYNDATNTLEGAWTWSFMQSR